MDCPSCYCIGIQSSRDSLSTYSEAGALRLARCHAREGVDRSECSSKQGPSDAMKQEHKMASQGESLLSFLGRLWLCWRGSRADAGPRHDAALLHQTNALAVPFGRQAPLCTRLPSTLRTFRETDVQAFEFCQCGTSRSGPDSAHAVAVCHATNSAWMCYRSHPMGDSTVVLGYGMPASMGATSLRQLELLESLRR